MKKLIKKFLSSLGIFFTKNQKYDSITVAILKKFLKPSSNVIDVGCHEGEFMDETLRWAPQGTHVAVEPLPYLASKLREKYKNKNVKVFNLALSDSSGESPFVHVEDAPAYSGLKIRKYPSFVKKIKSLTIKTDTLDHILHGLPCPDLVKIDVEGAEWAVLKGATATLKYCKPLIIFECGKGAADKYGTSPEKFWNWVKHYGYNIYTLKSFLNQKQPLGLSEFSQLFHTGSEYYFIARYEKN